MIEEHIAAVEKKLGEAGHELTAFEWLDIRLRIAEVRLKLENHDTVAGLLAELKPLLERSLGGGNAPSMGADESPNHRRARVLWELLGESADEEDNINAVAQALEQAEARGHDMAAHRIGGMG